MLMLLQKEKFQDLRAEVMGQEKFQSLRAEAVGQSWSFVSQISAQEKSRALLKLV